MNIVYLGTDVFRSSFDYLLEKHNIIALYTYHADEDCLSEYGVVKRARQKGIPVIFTPITEDEVKRYVTECDCNLFFSAEYSYYIPTMDDDRFKGLNLHCSLLPHGRSYYPIECGMHSGSEVFGVTMHKLVKKIDAGEIIAQEQVRREDIEDSVDAYIACDNAAYEMTKRLLENFDQVWNAAKSQDEVCPMQKRPAQEFMTICHEMTVEEAKEVYSKYNQMTQVTIDDVPYFIVSIMFGKVIPKSREYLTADDSALYALADGNARMILKEAKKG